MPPNHILCFEGYELDLDRETLRDTNGDVFLRPKSFAILRYLASNSGRLASKDDLVNAAWQTSNVSDQSIARVISDIRSALGDRASQIITTVPRRGYRFSATVETIERFEGEASKPAPPISIVVMPFINMGDNPAQDSFVDGLTDCLTTDLSRLHGAFVIARSTAFTYKDRMINVKDVGKDLNVRYVLEGTVHRQAELVRVNVQLADTSTGANIWTERFDKPLTNFFQTLDEITARLANQLSMTLLDAEAERARSVIDPNSMDLAFRGIAHLWAAGGNLNERIAAARECLEQSLARDPKNTRALVGLGMVECTIVFNYLADDPKPHVVTAEALFGRALESAPGNAMARQMMGILLSSTGRAEQGITELELALSIDPNLAMARAQLGLAQAFVGRAEETERHVAEALRLSPKDPFLSNWLVHVGGAKALLSQFEEALAWLQRATLANRQAPMPHFLAAACLARLSRLDEARSHTKVGLTLSPEFSIFKMRAGAHGGNAVYLAQREGIYEGLRLAGVPER